mmetsp:Transcript_30022/g.50818  ORF Transcript_30022/g.50818 Transcript_30022/m.50818 type:complete len:96 (-) Transcript_30022:259-546(-)
MVQGFLVSDALVESLGPYAGMPSCRGGQVSDLSSRLFWMRSDREMRILLSQEQNPMYFHCRYCSNIPCRVLKTTWKFINVVKQRATPGMGPSASC